MIKVETHRHNLSIFPRPDADDQLDDPRGAHSIQRALDEARIESRKTSSEKREVTFPNLRDDSLSDGT